MQQQYKIHFVGDDAALERDWALVQQANELILFVKESRLSSRVLEEAWAGYRHHLAQLKGAPA